MICHFSCKSECKKEKSLVSFMHEQNIICSQTQLDDIAHEQTIICRQLLICRSHVGLLASEKEEKFASNNKRNYCLSSIYRVPFAQLERDPKQIILTLAN